MNILYFNQAYQVIRFWLYVVYCNIPFAILQPAITVHSNIDSSDIKRKKYEFIGHKE